MTIKLTNRNRMNFHQYLGHGIFKVSMQGNYVFVDESLKVVFDEAFDYAAPYSEEIAIVVNGSMISLIDSTGKKTELADCDSINHFHSGWAFGSQNGISGWFTKSGDFKSMERIESTDGFSNGIANFRDSGKWGLINANLEEVVPPQFDYVGFVSEGLAPFVSKDKFGYLDISGTTVINPQFLLVTPFSNGLAAVCTDTYQGPRWGIIDQSGDWIVEPLYIDMTGINQNRTVASDGSSCFLISSDGQIVSSKFGPPLLQIYPRAFSFGFNETKIKLLNTPCFDHGILFYKDSKLTREITENSSSHRTLRVKRAIDKIFDTEQQLEFVLTDINGNTNLSFHSKTPLALTESMILIHDDVNFIFESIDHQGQVLGSATLHTPSAKSVINDPSNGAVITFTDCREKVKLFPTKLNPLFITKTTSFFIVNEKAEILSPPVTTEISATNASGKVVFSNAFEFEDEIYVTQGTMSRNGNISIPPAYQHINLGDDELQSAQEFFTGKWGVIDTTGNWILPARYLGMSKVFDSRVLARTDQGNLILINAVTGYQCSENSRFSKSYFTKAWDFSDGVWILAFKRKRNSSENWSIFDKDGSPLVEVEFSAMHPMRNGLARAIPKPTSRFRFNSNPNWGYVNVKGEFVIEPIFDETSNFCGDSAIVKRGGKTTIIDRTGSVVTEVPDGLAAVELLSDKRMVVKSIQQQKYFICDFNFQSIHEGLFDELKFSEDRKDYGTYMLRDQNPSTGVISIESNA